MLSSHEIGKGAVGAFPPLASQAAIALDGVREITFVFVLGRAAASVTGNMLVSVGRAGI